MKTLLCPIESAPAAAMLDECLVARGLRARGFLGKAGIEAVCAGLPAPLRARFGVDGAAGLAAVALAYGDGPAAPPAWAQGSGTLARIARFARADWYAELASRLRETARELRVRLRAAGMEPGPARSWRWLANSGLPERPLALSAGLGSLGRNGLLLVHGLGPGTVLGLLLLPFDPLAGGTIPTRAAAATAIPAAIAPAPEDLVPGGRCGSCRACVDACPTAALDPQGGFVRERCIQHWTARPGPVPPVVEAAWGGRLYGCDACLESCPRFRPDPMARTVLGQLGPGLPAAWLIGTDTREIRARLRGTALGLGWMDPGLWQRNARLALDPAPLFDAGSPVPLE